MEYYPVFRAIEERKKHIFFFKAEIPKIIGPYLEIQLINGSIVMLWNMKCDTHAHALTQKNPQKPQRHTKKAPSEWDQSQTKRALAGKTKGVNVSIA